MRFDFSSSLSPHSASGSRHIRMRFRWSFGKSVILVSVLTLAGAGVTGFYLYRWYTREFPEVALLKTHYPHLTYLGPKEPVRVQLKKNAPASWSKLGSIAPAAVGAIVVSEDWAFFQHDGVDTKQLKEAIKEDMEKGKFARGASTITMQVVKNVFLSKEKTLYRKAKEFLLAMEMNEDVPKKRVLEVYLNIAEWGEGIFGITAASHRYFQKSPSQLSPKEGAFLAMLLPSPKRYSQSYRSKELTRYANRTVKQILDKMVQAHYITPEERDIQVSTPLSFEKVPEGESGDMLAPDESVSEPTENESEPETEHEIDPPELDEAE
ncbi:MAG: hypothetical protein EOP09_01985 [Proteobacteria bacterium]|nr:MAG: hypothetical protein EOP09_01985 [Pseudomonadota bacterium]